MKGGNCPTQESRPCVGVPQCALVRAKDNINSAINACDIVTNYLNIRLNGRDPNNEYWEGWKPELERLQSPEYIGSWDNQVFAQVNKEIIADIEALINGNNGAIGVNEIKNRLIGIKNNLDNNQLEVAKTSINDISAKVNFLLQWRFNQYRYNWSERARNSNCKDSSQTWQNCGVKNKCNKAADNMFWSSAYFSNSTGTPGVKQYVDLAKNDLNSL
jgi:hypothetical protein